MSYTLGGVQIRVTLDHLKHHSTGEPPVLVLRPASLGEWSQWRRPEAAREQQMRASYLKRLAAAGLNELDVERAHTQMRAHADAAKQRSEIFAELAGREVAGEDVAALIADIQAQGEEAKGAWGDTVRLLMRLEDAPIDRVPDTLETTRHTLDFVQGCVTRIEGVSVQGVQLPWDDAALAQMGLTKGRVLEELLGAGEEALVLLYELATRVRYGLSEQEKKA